jgi:hypothetical protein
MKKPVIAGTKINQKRLALPPTLTLMLDPSTKTEAQYAQTTTL